MNQPGRLHGAVERYFRLAPVTVPIYAILVAIVVGGLVILASGANPVVAYAALFRGAFGDLHQVAGTLARATPFVIAALAVAFAFKAGLFNIGAEGQLAAGSFATAVCGASLPAGTPGPLAVVLCISAAMLAGGLIGALPGLLKARYGAHEVINTIMLNFIVSALVLWAGNALFFVAHTTHTRTVIKSAAMSHLGFPGSAANTSLILALVIAVLVHLFLTRTRRGFEWRAVGFGLRAAENAGVSIPGAIVGVMTLAGALAGAVGANYVLGYKHYFERDIGAGTGFMGIAVALLGRGHPAGIVAAAFLFATLSHGGLGVSRLVPKELVDILQAVIILAVAAAAAWAFRNRTRAAAAPPPPTAAVVAKPEGGA
jgi:simple sugar transport system permease protein